LTAAEVADRAQVSIDEVRRIWRATGLPDPGSNAPVFSEVEAELIASFHLAESLMGRDPILQLTRVMGLAMARVADAMVSAFIVNVVAPNNVSGEGGLALAKANAEATALIPEASKALDVLLRRHIETARRPMTVLDQGIRFETQHLAVGFGDLVGSTALAQQLSISELGAALGEFEEMALDVIAGQGARLVKLIGDEVMFVSSDVIRACEIGLRLRELVAAHDVLPALRVGMAIGEILSKDGDYFGPVVNLAARATKLARSDDVVVSSELRATVERDENGNYLFEDLGALTARGFQAPIHLHALRRAAVPLVDP
jgi:adenylate cyclase